MNNENLKNKLVEREEILSADEQKISYLIGSLEKVSAPNDFDFRLKARIANAVKQRFSTFDLADASVYSAVDGDGYYRGIRDDSSRIILN